MTQDLRELAWRVAQIVLIALAFAAVSYLVQHYKTDLAAVLGDRGIAGPLFFILFTAVLVVVLIPIDLVFLVPLGVALWGPVATALLSVAGWTIGAAAAFGLARWYGRPLVVRVIGERRVLELERRVPTANLFWLVVLLRMCIPVDLLSYALGLTSTLSWWRYLLATLIGVTPFAFAGTLPVARQLATIIAGLAAASLIFYFIRRFARRESPAPVSGDDPSHGD